MTPIEKALNRLSRQAHDRDARRVSLTINEAILIEEYIKELEVE